MIGDACTLHISVHIHVQCCLLIVTKVFAMMMSLSLPPGRAMSAESSPLSSM